MENLRSARSIVISLLIWAFIMLKPQCVEDICPNEHHPVSITFVEAAVLKGAVCLDGSPPAYYFDKGFGGGISNWLIYFEGGGWCRNVTECYKRVQDSNLGSSVNKTKIIYFQGMLSKTQTNNPDFFSWNKVYVGYCDGSSFTGDVEAVDPAHFNRKHLPGLKKREDRFAEVVSLHGSDKFLPSSCTSKRNPGLCLFPEYLVNDIQTPLFLVNSLFDQWQIKENLDPRPGDELGWENCTTDLNLCSSSQLETIKDFGMDFVKSLLGLGNTSSRGMFINSCYSHGQNAIFVETSSSQLLLVISIFCYSILILFHLVSTWFFPFSVVVCYWHADCHACC
ncbi:Pectin acetylesterase 11 [Abeliophyllum distichum]|uniref:Pectin acetylesterase n=1 Tax=Abeliophyllum distichum TaxID=126358 RepID=A0ABD1NPQ1_9LAMI